MRNRVLTLAAAVVMPFAASTQEVPAPTPAVAAPSNVISFQPLIAVFEVYSAEYERKVASATTLGIGGTYWNFGDDELTYTSGDLKLRYYPQGTALMGFSFGGSVGFTSISATNTFDGTEESASGATLGVLLEYQWLMGAKRNVSAALGLGAKALMVDEDEITSGDFVARYPTGRVSIGFAF
jgi:hypothetical protein